MYEQKMQKNVNKMQRNLKVKEKPELKEAELKKA
jgi:hypothetical protein